MQEACSVCAWRILPGRSLTRTGYRARTNTTIAGAAGERPAKDFSEFVNFVPGNNPPSIGPYNPAWRSCSTDSRQFVMMKSARLAVSSSLSRRPSLSQPPSTRAAFEPTTVTMCCPGSIQAPSNTGPLELVAQMTTSAPRMTSRGVSTATNSASTSFATRLQNCLRLSAFRLKTL
jgi:hypothetical protein